MQADSRLDVDALDQARALLSPPQATNRSLPALMAAAFAAFAALALAVTVVMMPLVAPIERPPTATLGR